MSRDDDHAETAPKRKPNVAPVPPPPPRASKRPPGRWFPLVGEVFAGSYRAERVLGQGAMGVVLLCRDMRLEREVAIKLIHPDYVTSPESHQRFLEEARAMARVRHENVVELYAFDEHEGVPYFVMEYVPGQHVEEWVKRYGGVPAIDEVIGILDQVCRGVSAIHRAGTVHRDLKWTNVLVGPAFRVAVTDLGLARILDRPRKPDNDTVSGTPAYMAPEIVLGTPIPSGMHERADVYSLGVMAFEILTSHLPFETPDADEMMRMHVRKKAPIPSEVRPDLPVAFDRVILNAMEKDPTKRTPSADVFRRELLEARESASAGASGIRILIADDDPDFVDLARETLGFAFPGAELVTVENGDEALAAIDLRPFAFALVDLDMPGLNGIELTAAIRASRSAASMPILVATATGGAPDWKLLSSLGADGFLVKPIDPMALVALARRTLGRKH